MHIDCCQPDSELQRSEVMEFVAIGQDGTLAGNAGIETGDAMTESVIQGTVEFYGRAGFVDPWISYLAVEESRPVGVCSFKSSPWEGRVEIAYFTFPENEGRGIATRMAEHLIQVAAATDPAIQVFAQTLPESNGSTRILQKLGFRHTQTIEHPEDGTVWEWEIHERN